MASAKTTIDHGTIKRWVEERGGYPARVKGTGAPSDPGILRIDYPGFSGQKTLESIDWGTFFEAFEDNELAFLYQDEPQSRFSKLIDRERMNEAAREHAAARSAARKRSSVNDAVSLLESQHRELESLFEQLRGAESKGQRTELFNELADKLAAHAKIEETIFYPAVCADETVEQLHHSVREHLEIKQALAGLLEMDVAQRDFMTRLETLQQLVEHHVGEEEKVLFVAVRDQDLIDLEVVGKRLRKRFDELIGSAPRNRVPNEIDAPAELPC